MSSFLLNDYLSTSLLIFISWISLFIPCRMVPGRVALLVTVFLMIINISNRTRSEAPISAGLTALDLWLMACVIFESAVLCEYAVMLRIMFGSLSEENVTVAETWSEPSRDVSVETELEKRCARMDRRCFRLLLSLWIIFNLTYWLVFWNF